LIFFSSGEAKVWEDSKDGSQPEGGAVEESKPRAEPPNDILICGNVIKCS